MTKASAARRALVKIIQCAALQRKNLSLQTKVRPALLAEISIRNPLVTAVLALGSPLEVDAVGWRGVVGWCSCEAGANVIAATGWAVHAPDVTWGSTETKPRPLLAPSASWPKIRRAIG